MELESMIGMRLAVGFPGTEATTDLIEGLRRIRAQHLIVFSRNFESPDQLRRLLRRLEEMLERRLWVMVDHEGGRTVRFHSGVTQFPDALTIGKTEPPQVVERQGAVEAEELKQLGIRINLAPCVDVLVPGSDPVIGTRSYGTDPARVARLAVARIRGLQSHGVAACAKHFPGLGAVPRDPHRTLPTIALGWQELEEVHLPPFEAAIGAGVATVMSSHVCYPGLGEPPGVPATFSRRLIHELLRIRMGFHGLILSDDLEMGALRELGTMGEAAVRATEAGHDLLLICSDLQAAEEAAAALRRAYQDGRLKSGDLEDSVERISEAMRRFSSLCSGDTTRR